jgi:hypothetical protein
MSDEKLFHPGPPACYAVVATASELEDLRLRSMLRRPRAVVRVLRGGRCRNVTGLFGEVGAALQFPYYFGENWAAFDECITDLDWLDGDAYLLLVNESQALLADADAEDFRILLETLTRANVEWLTPNAYIPRSREPTPFHVVFQVDDGHLDTFRARLEAANASAEVLRLPDETG